MGMAIGFNHFAQIPKIFLPLAACVILLTGCQFSAPPAMKRASVQPTRPDILPVEKQESLKVQWARPADWKPLPTTAKSPLYTHVQYRSPTLSTGFGVAYIHLPIPLSAKAIVWFAKSQYTKQSSEGRLVGEWTDALGRYWFEAENNKYHVKGYAVTKGFDAWIIYSGFKTTRPPHKDEIAIATRCSDAIIPLPLLKPSHADSESSASAAAQ
jgi:hypothetical protein